MDIKNLTGLEKPLEKLIETVSEGIGVVGNHLFGFDVAKIKRIGKAEAEAEKIKIVANAEAREKVVKVLGRAEKRVALEQYNKQINLENILVKTRDDLERKTVSEESVERDWTMKFLDIAQNVSREELQDVLAKILSGEVQKPGSFSYQTLEVVKYLSQKDLQKFLKFVAISTNIGVIKLRSGGKDSLEKYGLKFDDYLDLSSIGLFNQSSMISYAIDLPPSTPFQLDIGNDAFLITHTDKQNAKKFDFGLHVFSNVGREVRALLLENAKNIKSDEFKKDFIEESSRKGFNVEHLQTKE
ncbi:MAG: DUF2806 domain-containing protein [Candidatus Curtissbacteria bacterium]|nr:DUF2806 domain-containing protein [Candidatus Curtissbacteria bacterium]